MKTVIVLHGWNSQSEKWLSVKQQLEKNKFQVLVPSLPGFKSKLNEAWDLDDYVAWLKKYLAGRKLAKPTLLGHSFGGRVAIKFAACYPKLVDKLILVGAAGIRDKRLPAVLKREIFKLVAKAGRAVPLPLAGALRRGLYFLARERDYLNAQGSLKETMNKVIGEDLKPLLTKVKIPTLVVWGENDRLVPLSVGKTMAGKIPQAELKILRGVGHSPHLEAPAKLTEKITQWLLPR